MKRYILFALFFPLYAMAGTSITQFQASAQMVGTCDVAAKDINFGTVTLSGNVSKSTPSPTSSQMNLKCSNNISYKVTLSSGSSGSYSARTMKGSTPGNTDTLNYNIYTTSDASTVWGDGTNGSGYYTAQSQGQTTNWTAYISYNTNQYVTPDNYIDNITATISY